MISYRLCIARTSIKKRFISSDRPPAGLTRGYCFSDGRFFMDEFGWTWGGVEAMVSILRRSKWITLSPEQAAQLAQPYTPARWAVEAAAIGFDGRLSK